LLILAGLVGCGSPGGASATVTGFIEAEEISLAPEVGGRVIALPVEVGDEVQPGDLLVRLDDRIPQAQVALAEAQVAEAAARLDMAREGATASEIKAAEARVLQAAAGREGACRAWQDAQAMLKNPQEINRQIAVTEAQIRAADAGRNAAQARLQAAGVGVDQLESAQDAISKLPTAVTIYDGPDSASLPLPAEVMEVLTKNPGDGSYSTGDYTMVRSSGHLTVSRALHVGLPNEAHLAPNYYWQATIGVNAATASYEGLQATLKLLYALRSNPREIKAQVDLAEAQCHEAEAQETAAQAGVDALQAGATSEELAVLEATLEQAQAGLAQAQALLSKQTLTSPLAGVVLERGVDLGELAVPQKALLTLADLDTVQLTVYLPNIDLERAKVGATVAVRVANFADQVFNGTVTYIGQEAEFPPQDVPRQDEREALSFAVRIQIANPDHLLKPGMPAEVTWGQP
jgi:multidrug resistance efflux pump